MGRGPFRRQHRYLSPQGTRARRRRRYPRQHSTAPSESSIYFLLQRNGCCCGCVAHRLRMHRLVSNLLVCILCQVRVLHVCCMYMRSNYPTCHCSAVIDRKRAIAHMLVMKTNMSLSMITNMSLQTSVQTRTITLCTAYNTICVMPSIIMTNMFA